MGLLACHRQISIARGGFHDTIRESVRAKYAENAIRLRDEESCCDRVAWRSDAISGPSAKRNTQKRKSRRVGLSLVRAASAAATRRRSPSLHAGEIVLDLGSGAGLDDVAFRATGFAWRTPYGVDMTDEMLSLANENRGPAGVENATFLKGTIETFPSPTRRSTSSSPTASSTSPPTRRRCCTRRSACSSQADASPSRNMVEVEPLPGAGQVGDGPWAGCVSGTIPVDEYRAAVVEAGFAAVEIEITNTYGPGEAGLAAGVRKKSQRLSSCHKAELILGPLVSHEKPSTALRQASCPAVPR